ncbi:MAG: hypothetical protein JSW52_10765, partial [Candidatus Coatesbacteria bacterium]
DGKGTEEVLAAIEEHRGYIESAGIGAERRRARAKRELMELLERDILGAVTGSNGFEEAVDAAITRILGRDSTPYREAEKISKAFKLNELSRS